METIKVALCDDHNLLRTALASLIESFENCKVIYHFSNGRDLIERMHTGQIPDIIILDLNMPILDGQETAKWVHEHYPQVHILMLTMYNTELTMIRLLQVGVRGFLKKDVHPSELKFAITSVMHSGYYYSNNTTGKLVNLFRKAGENTQLHKNMLTELEIRFLKLTCTELTYKEIAEEMNLNPRSIDNMRDNLFTKLDVKSRVGLAMYSVKHGIQTF
jgi:two-component system, NarL family, invasion response regulator UvrY